MNGDWPQTCSCGCGASRAQAVADIALVEMCSLRRAEELFDRAEQTRAWRRAVHA